MTITNAQPTPPAVDVRRLYATPALVVHGDVQRLTLGKNGTDPDLDSTGSFTPVPSGG